jgi:hypothetical protein
MAQQPEQHVKNDPPGGHCRYGQSHRPSARRHTCAHCSHRSARRSQARKTTGTTPTSRRWRTPAAPPLVAPAQTAHQQHRVEIDMRVEEGEGEAGHTAALSDPAPDFAASSPEGEIARFSARRPHRRQGMPRRPASPSRSADPSRKSPRRAPPRQGRSAASDSAQIRHRMNTCCRSSPWRRMKAFCAPMAMISEPPSKKPAIAGQDRNDMVSRTTSSGRNRLGALGFLPARFRRFGRHLDAGSASRTGSCTSGPLLATLLTRSETGSPRNKSVRRGNHQVRHMPRLLVETIEPAGEILGRDHHRHAVMDRRHLAIRPHGEHGGRVHLGAVGAHIGFHQSGKRDDAALLGA